MTSGTLVSRGLGFLRSILLVAAIGGTSAAVGGQAFDVANNLPTNLFTLIAGGVLGSVLVPQIVRALGRADGGREYLDQVFTLALVGGLVFTAAAVVCAPLLVQLYVSDWPSSWLRLATTMTYWCLPQMFFLIAFSVLGQVMNATSRFGAYMWAPAISNVVAIAGIVVFLLVIPNGTVSAEAWTPGMVALIAGFATAGTLTQALILWFVITRSGIRFRWRFSLQGLGQTGRTAGWTFLGVLAGQVAFVFTSSAASGAGAELNRLGVEGASLNSLSNAYLIVLLPHALVTVSVVTALFTRMSASAANDRHHEVTDIISAGTGIISISGVVATVFLVAFGPLLGEALWDSATIGQVISRLAFMIVPFSVIYLTQRASLSYENALSPFIQAISIAALIAIGSILSASLLPPTLVVLGIAASIAVAHWVAAIYGWFAIRTQLKQRSAWKRASRKLLARGAIQVALALVGIGSAHLLLQVVPLITESLRFDAVFRVALAATVTVLVYSTGCLLTRDPSARRFIIGRRTPGSHTSPANTR
ncbi:murein biosynthesis integral membrane protein MurJ [Plantibacter sp. RU18]|uniref:murein biosynthesis integral membrane protein MurJ n=1 Tax=Plantibacter sp. RU18 TaxID=3158143 RepID=UPI003D36C94E